VSEGDSEVWAAVARAISGREFGWRQRGLIEHSHAPVTVVWGIQRPGSLGFSGISLSMPAITFGIQPFSHEALMQFQCISSATDSGSAGKRSATTVQPRCRSLIRRFTGRRRCR
jgi:hypothetical protein